MNVFVVFTEIVKNGIFLKDWIVIIVLGNRWESKLFDVITQIAGFFSRYLTNRGQFSIVYTLIDHEMTSKNVQNSSGTTGRRRVVSLPSFGHFMASFYGL